MIDKIRGMPRFDMLIVVLGIVVGFLAIPTINKALAPSLLSPGTFVSKMINAGEGGSVELADGTRIDIPPGALSSDTVVSISVPATSNLVAALPKDAIVVIREINAQGSAINRPVKLTFPYIAQAQDDMRHDSVVAWLDGRNWTLLDGQIDSQRRTIAVEINHLSTFGVFNLPSPDTLIHSMVDSACGPKNLNSHWTQLANAIREKNNASEALPKVNVYNQEKWNTFSLIKLNEIKFILADDSWYNDEAAWIPIAKRDLLAAPILGHELSHGVRGDMELDSVSSILKEAIRSMSGSEYQRLFKAYLITSYLAILNGDCIEARLGLGSLVNASILYATKDTCARYQQIELNADLDGANWASRYAGDPSLVGLIFIHWLKERGGADFCTHPSGLVRAKNIQANLKLDSKGGVFGTITVIGVSPLRASPGAPLADVDITLNDRLIAKTDENGQFMVIGLDPGDYTLGYYISGYQQKSAQITIDSQDLADASARLAWTPGALSTPAAQPTPYVQPTVYVPQPTVFIPPPTVYVPPPPVYVPPTQTPPPAGPTFNYFQAHGNNLNPGECISISWSVSNAREVYFEGSGVAGTAAMNVCPRQTTTYTLRYVGFDGSVNNRTVTITVLAPRSAPVAIISAIEGGCSGGISIPCVFPLTLDGTGSQAQGGRITQFHWTGTVVMYQGTTKTQTIDANGPSIRIAITSGPRTVVNLTLTVTDDRGATNTTTYRKEYPSRPS